MERYSFLYMVNWIQYKIPKHITSLCWSTTHASTDKNIHLKPLRKHIASFLGSRSGRGGGRSRSRSRGGSRSRSCGSLFLILSSPHDDYKTRIILIIMTKRVDTEMPKIAVFFILWQVT